MDTITPFAEERQAFLVLFPPLRRGPVTNLFLAPIREAGASTPRAILGRVVAELERRIERAYDRAYTADAQDMLDLITTHPTEALGFARWALEWERLPRNEREIIKRGRQKEYISQWMAEQLPTDRQLAYLESLGYRGEPPPSRQAASEAIDQLRRKVVTR